MEIRKRMIRKLKGGITIRKDIWVIRRYFRGQSIREKMSRSIKICVSLWCLIDVAEDRRFVRESIRFIIIGSWLILWSIFLEKIILKTFCFDFFKANLFCFVLFCLFICSVFNNNLLINFYYFLHFYCLLWIILINFLIKIKQFFKTFR